MKFLHISDLHKLNDYRNKGGIYTNILNGMEDPFIQLNSLLKENGFTFDFVVLSGDFGSIVELIGENYFFLIALVIPFVPYIIEGFSTGGWSWVPILIILGGALSIIIIDFVGLLLMYLIMFIVECIEDNSYGYINYVDTKNNVKNVNTNTSVKQPTVENKNNINNNKQNLEHKPTNKKKGVTFKDIAGLNEAKEAFKEKVILPFEHPEIFKKFGKKTGGGILLYGLPGTGKTMFAEAASNESDALFISVKCSDIKSKWYGESEQKVKLLFDTARKAKKAIIFFDEFEAIGSKRNENPLSGVSICIDETPISKTNPSTEFILFSLSVGSIFEKHF